MNLSPRNTVECLHLTWTSTDHHPRIIFLLILLICITMLLNGCATTPFEIKDYELTPVSKTKIPLRTGLYLSKEFQSYRTRGQLLGPGMTKGAIQATSMAFEEVVVLDSNDSGETYPKNIEMVMTPEIIYAGMIRNEPNLTTCQVALKWSIKKRDGKIVYVNTIRGEGSDNTFSGRTRIENCVTQATKDHYQKFLYNMLTSKWWEAIQ